MHFDRLEEILSQFTSRRIAVIGDFFLDKYLEIDPSLVETSVETGRQAHQVVNIRTSPGAAGTVVNNLVALGAGTVHAVGAIGDDGEAYDLKVALATQGCTTSGLLQVAELHTPTYLKPRDATRSDLTSEWDRFDTKNRDAFPEQCTVNVIAAMDAILPDVDAVVILDQVEEDECGVVTRTLRKAMAARAKQFPKIFFWADSRRRIRQFRNVITKPNQFEIVDHANPQPNERIELEAIERALPELRCANNAPVCVTLGERGMLVSDPEITFVPGVRVDGPIDPTGAGDSATAGAVLALTSGATLPEAALVGNLVASITIQQLATTGTASRDQLAERLAVWKTQQNIAKGGRSHV